MINIKIYKSLVVLAFIFICESIYGQHCLTLDATDVNGNENVTIDCDYPLNSNKCFTLQADFTIPQLTSSYAVESIPFDNSIPINTGTLINENVPDDTWGEVIDIPFSFCFFGNNFSQIVVSDNGMVSFNTSYSGQEAVFTAATLPNPNLYRNTIYALYHDLTNDDNVLGCNDNPNTPQNECGEILINTVGNYPCRKFVINFSNLNHFGCTQIHSSFQLVLYEGTNVIEVNVLDKPENCEVPNPNTDYRKKATIGVMNGSGTVAYFPPNRNAAVFDISDESYQFLPSGGNNYELLWLDSNQNNLGDNSSLTICDLVPETYTAQVTYNQCGGEPIILTDEVEVVIDPSYPFASNYIFENCDVNLDGVEEVDLTTIFDQINPNYTNFTLTVHPTLTDAQNNTNTISNISNYVAQNNGSVYIRVETDPSCFDIGKVTFNFAPAATISQQDIQICDIGSDNSQEVNLEIYNAVLVEDDEDYEIGYYLTQSDAQNGVNNFTQYTFTQPTTTIWIKASLDGCDNIQPINIILSPIPLVNDISITACSANYYDLTQHAQEIISNTGDYIISYYENYSQANAGNLSIDGTNVLLTLPEYFVRVQDSETGCYSVAQINVDYLPVPTLDEGILVICVNEGVTTANFNLSAALPQMCINTSDFIIDYYTSLSAAVNGDSSEQIPANQIANYTAMAPNETVYVRFYIIDTGCVEVRELNLVISETPLIYRDIIYACAGEDNPDEITIMLHSYDDALIGTDLENPNNFTYYIEYYASEADAQNAVNPLNEYEVTDLSTIYVKVVVGVPIKDNELNPVLDQFGNPTYIEVCSAIYPLNVDLAQSLNITETPLEICNNFNNEFETLDLNDYTDAYTSNPVYHDFQYLRYTFAPTSPSNSNVLIGHPEFYLQFYNENDCLVRVKYPVNFIPAPELAPTTLEICDFENNGEETINLNDYINQVITPTNDYIFSFYTDELGAMNENSGNLISNSASYNVTAQSPIIYCRVESNETTCVNVVSLEFEFQPAPAYGPELYICTQDGQSNFPNFNLDYFDSQVLDDPSYEIEYYESHQDAVNQENEVFVSDVYDGQGWYVRLDSPLGCTFVVFLEVFLFDEPILNTNIDVCDDNDAGIEEVSTDEIAELIIENSFYYDFTFYYTQEDLNNQTNAIDPDTPLILNSSTQLYVHIQFNPVCFTTSMINLDFIPSPETFDGEDSTCDLGNDLQETFDLTSYLEDLCPGYTQYEVSYYNNVYAANVEDVNAALTTDPTQYVAQQFVNHVYIRFENTVTGCYSVSDLTLNLIANPKIINSPLTICENDNTQDTVVDLTSLNNAIIDVGENPDDFTFTYFLTQNDADNNVNPIPDPTNFTANSDTFTIYIRVSNSFGCYSISESMVSIREQIQIDPVTSSLEICDVDNDNMEVVDLTIFQDDISTSATEFLYFTTEQDMLNNTNWISDPSQYTSIGNKTIYVRVKQEDLCDNFTEFPVILLPSPTNSLPTEFVICPEEDVEIGVSPGYSSYQWLETGDNTSSILVNNAGEYTVTVTNDEGCISNFTINVTESAPPIISIDYTSINSIEILYDDDSDILEFSLDGNQFSTQAIFENLAGGTYMLYYRRMGESCVYTDTFIINLDSNVITPNGDGINDVWTYSDQSFFTGGAASFTLYDRYGKIIKEQSSDSQFSWNGKYLGRNVSTGTYWYIMKNLEGKIIKGWIMVKNRPND